MYNEYLSALSNMPGATELVLVNGISTDYSLTDGTDWGNAMWQRSYSGNRGTQGGKLASATSVNREVTLAMVVQGISHDDLESNLSDLYSIAEEFRRFGGRITWRPNGATHRQHFIVLDAGIRSVEFDTKFVHHSMARVEFAAVCQPLLHGDKMDIYDDFSVNSIANYTFDTGSATVNNGQLESGASLVRMRHTNRGYLYGDCQATIKFTTGPTITNIGIGPIIKSTSPDMLLYMAALAGSINIYKRIGPSTETLLLSGAYTMVANTVYWLRLRIEGNVVHAEIFTSEPTPMGTPASSISYSLTSAEIAQFGSGVEGSAGLRWARDNTTERVDDLSIEPYTYRNVSHPEELALRGSIPGDAPALADLHVTASGGTNPPQWAIFGWWPRPLPWSMVWNGDYEDDTNGWSNAAVTNINAASTSITRVSAASKYGAYSLEVNCPGATDPGAQFAIYRRFKKGVLYTATAWIQSSSSTSNVYIRMGNGPANDKASSGNTALSNTWQQISVSWIPTADRDIAHVALNVGDINVATIFRIDGVSVYEGIPTLRTQIEGRGALPPLGVIEAESCDTGNLEGGLALVANADSRLGYALEGAAGQAGGSLIAKWFIDPALILGDDFTGGEVSMEVWGRITLPSTATSCTVKLSVEPELGTLFGSSRYAEEFGSVGRALGLVTSPLAGLYRLGTLRLLVNRTSTKRWKLKVGIESTGSGTISLDNLVILPSNGRALSPSGRSTGFPKFISSIAATTKVVMSDLTGFVGNSLSSLYPDHGLGGSMIELPQGNVDMMLRLSSHIADVTPGVGAGGNDGTEHSRSASIHLSVTPRFYLARS